LTTQIRPESPLAEHGAAWVEAELDALELVPFSNPQVAFGPAIELERQARELGADALIKRAQLVQADVLGRIGKHTASGQLVREINAWAVAHSDRRLEARSHRMLSMFYDSLGDAPSAWQHALKSVELLEDSASPRLRAEHLFGLATSLHRSGAFDLARSRYESAGRLAEGAGDTMLQLKVLNGQAWLEDDAGDAQKSLEIGDRMKEFAASHGVLLDAACLDTIAHAQLLLGEYASAEATLRPVLDDPDFSARPTEGLAESLRTAGEALRHQGKLVEAQACLERCMRLCEERGLGQQRVEAMEQQAMLHAAHGDFEKAYRQHIAFHEAEVALRAEEREANSRTLQAVFETEEARDEGERFREMALRDALTGLRNRRYVDAELPPLLTRAVFDGSALAVGLVDIDHFKQVNDTFSHAVGDQVLCKLADLLEAAAGEAGIAARMGGEEFLVVFRGSRSVERFEALRRRVEAYRWARFAPGLALTISIGATRLRPGRTSQAALLGEADRHLYAAKSAGRNRVVLDPD
jgi:two-component system, cell cycle response regulator